MHNRHAICGIVFVCSTLPAPLLSAQQSSGTFNGTVTDASGAEGRNDLRGDPFQNTDLSLLKNLQIQKLGSLQFRAEAFNAFNHLTYGNPDGNISDTTFGVIGSARSTERQLQLAAKFLF